MDFFYGLSQKIGPAGIVEFWRKPDNPLFRVSVKIPQFPPARSSGSDGIKVHITHILKAFNPLFQTKKDIEKTIDF